AARRPPRLVHGDLLPGAERGPPLRGDAPGIVPDAHGPVDRTRRRGAVDRRRRRARSGPRSAHPGDGQVRGRTALVTGGSRGIGRAIVLELAGRGARVRFVHAADEAAAAEVSSLARAAGGEALGTRVDVRDRERIRAWVASVVADTGSVGILVNN